MAAENGSNDSALHKLIKTGRRYRVQKKQIIQTTDDRQVVNLVISGFVKRYLISNDGNVGVQIIYGAGDIFPLTLFFRSHFHQDLYSGPETFFYEAMRETEVYSIDLSQLIEEVEIKPKLYADLLVETGRHLEFCVSSLENLSLKTSDKRIAHQLLTFAKKFGKPTLGGGRQITVPLSHQDIGEILSITRETVTTNMSILRKKGLIKIDKDSKNIVVPDMQKLQDEAYS